MTDARAALRALYADLEAELRRHGPVCELSGRCCRFAEYGHDLFVTELELQELFDGCGPPPRPVPDRDDAVRACPYQDGKACGAHTHRPLGCRTFYCDPRFEDAMPGIAEAYHARLRALHQTHEVPYRYGELLRMLEAAD